MRKIFGAIAAALLLVWTLMLCAAMLAIYGAMRLRKGAA